MFEKELEKMIQAAKAASAEIMKIYSNGFSVKTKDDESPVTDADIVSDKIIREHLSVFDDIAWLSEEDADDLSRLTRRKLFIVDPLDGTSDFVNKDGSFGINIALVVDHRPVCSVVAVPAMNTYAYAMKGKGSYYVDENGREERMHVSSLTENLRVLVSKTHRTKEDDELFKRHASSIKELIPMGASTKAIYLSRGLADACIRITDKTKEWDVCAPELIVTEAGGVFVDLNRKEFVYNREDVHNHDGYCMLNRKENEFLLS